MDGLEDDIYDLTASLSDLESALQPILSTTLITHSTTLPLLDKAKLYVITTYAIESILFSYLRLNGVDINTHPVLQELNRVKAYFGKIKSAEAIGAGGRGGGAGRLDKAAAGRFIKHGLIGNEKFDRERAERQAKEKSGAKRKMDAISTGTHTRFNEAAKRRKDDVGETVEVVRASDVEEGSVDEATHEEGQDEKGKAETNGQIEDSLLEPLHSNQSGQQKSERSSAEKQHTSPGDSSYIGSPSDKNRDGQSSKKKSKREKSRKKG